ncbi:MAG: glycosyltransferase [Acetobacteraceae bacterium]|nr:glycosyltransferase [Acetobacteraceae bacterium]
MLLPMTGRETSLQVDVRRETLSAVVISYNRADIIGTCLRALGFADELIVVDKSSTDETPAIAASNADRVISVPWTPAVEDTRAFAVEQCTHDWILLLDDDECLSPEAVRFIIDELVAPRAEAYEFPLRHYILGVHDERAYYWPEHHIRLFRRGAAEFGATVHAGISVKADALFRVSAEGGICIHHLSHQNVAHWISKANRYTSRLDRVCVEHFGRNLARFAHARIDYWMARTQDSDPGGYPAAAALLRATYDLIDRLKTWEEEEVQDGAALFRAVCASLDAAHDPATPKSRTDNPRAESAMQDNPDTTAALAKRVKEFRQHYDALAVATNEERERLLRQEDELRQELARLAAEQQRLTRERDDAIAQMRSERQRAEGAEASRRDAEAARIIAEATCREAEEAQRISAMQADSAAAALRAIESSTCWRATALLRRIGSRITGRELGQ